MNVNNLMGGNRLFLNNRGPMMNADGAETGAAGSTETGGADGAQTQTTAAEAPGWTKGLKADLQNNEYFTSKKTVSELAEDALSMRSRLENAIVRPGEDATDEDRAAFRKAMGVPETSEGYQLGNDENDQTAKWFAGEAHKVGLDIDSAKSIYNAFNQYATDTVTKQREELIKSTESTLRNEWGDAYDTRIAKVTAFAKEYGGEQVKVNDIDTIRMINKFTEMVSEDNFGGGRTGGGSEKREPGQLSFSKSFGN